MNIGVVAPGLLTTLQDLGRPTHTATGVGCAGAMDTVALRLANALVGNDASHAGLEITLRGPTLVFDATALVAVTGGDVDVTCNGAAVPRWRPILLAPGSTLEIGVVHSGTRAYMAIAGGIVVDAILGSRSTDVNAAIGPAPLRAEIGWPQKRAPARAPTIFDAPNWSLDPAPWFDAYADRAIAIIRGAHFDKLDVGSQRALLASEFRVASQSNRVGYRLDGPRLTFIDSIELISEGTVPGTIQLPPNGQPIALMSEAPTTGGYPRIAHVASVDLPRLAQRRPGDTVRFAEVSIAEAQTRYLRRERALRILQTVISERRERWLA